MALSTETINQYIQRRKKAQQIQTRVAHQASENSPFSFAEPDPDPINVIKAESNINGRKIQTIIYQASDNQILTHITARAGIGRRIIDHQPQVFPFHLDSAPFLLTVFKAQQIYPEIYPDILNALSVNRQHQKQNLTQTTPG